MTSRRVTTARLIVMLNEPLLTDADRKTITDNYRELVTNDPAWAGAWTSGLIRNALSSLPPNDPWRHVQARFGGVSFGGIVDMPETASPNGLPELAWSPRGWFGTSEDHTDLVLSDFPGDRLADLGLAAAHSSLPPGTATMIAAAGSGEWRCALAAWWLVRTFSTGSDGMVHGRGLPAEALSLSELRTARGRQVVVDPADAGLAAVRAVSFRRRTYLGNTTDHEFATHAHEGIRWSDEVARELEGLPIAWLDQAVTEGTWDQLLGPVKAFDAWNWPEEFAIPPDAYDEFLLD